MGIESIFSVFFRPEYRRKGELLYTGGLVRMQQASEANVAAFVDNKARVTLESDGMDSIQISARCSCTKFRSGHGCMHIWATLLQLEKDGAEFLSNKNELEFPQRIPTAADKVREEKMEAVAEKKREDGKRIRAEQKKRKQLERRAANQTTSPAEAEALSYFSTNGFSFILPVDPEELDHAKKILARVFHPDRGGTHEEMLELNRHTETLTS